MRLNAPADTTGQRRSASESAEESCLRAKQLEERGMYEEAALALGNLWKGIGLRPRVSGLERPAQAEVLLRAGVITGWLGRARQLEGAIETAKNLLSESRRLFEQAGHREKAAEASTELGLCYWREGAPDDAHVQFDHALDLLKDAQEEAARAVTILRIATVETSSTRYNDALGRLTGSRAVFDAVADHSLKGRYHNTLTVILKNLGEGEDRRDYTDRALIEAEAARYHFEQAGSARFLAFALNNLGSLLFVTGDFGGAVRALGRARRLSEEIRDEGNLAEVDETRARVLIAQGFYEKAERAADNAVRIQELGDQQAHLAEALITRGRARARLGRGNETLADLTRAYETAVAAGSRECAGRAHLALIDELGAHMTFAEMSAAFLRANELLAATQHPETIRQLRRCAVATVECARREAAGGSDFAPVKLITLERGLADFRKEIERYEGALIKRAMSLTGNRVEAAAALLGMANHQTLSDMLKRRHRGLLGEEFHQTRRRKGIIVKGD